MLQALLCDATGLSQLAIGYQSFCKCFTVKCKSVPSPLVFSDELMVMIVLMSWQKWLIAA